MLSPYLFFLVWALLAVLYLLLTWLLTTRAPKPDFMGSGGIVKPS